MLYTDLRRGRASIGGQIYLVTTVVHDREPLFTSLYFGRLVVRTLYRAEMAVRATTLAYVIMPDHLHWLLQLHTGHTLSTVVWSVKGRSAFDINRARGTRGAVWQPSFHDHALRKEEDLQSVARYVVCNPLRARLVRSIYDYSLWDAIWM